MMNWNTYRTLTAIAWDSSTATHHFHLWGVATSMVVFAHHIHMLHVLHWMLVMVMWRFATTLRCSHGSSIIAFLFLFFFVAGGLFVVASSVFVACISCGCHRWHHFITPVVVLIIDILTSFFFFIGRTSTSLTIDVCIRCWQLLLWWLCAYDRLMRCGRLSPSSFDNSTSWGLIIGAWAIVCWQYLLLWLSTDRCSLKESRCTVGLRAILWMDTKLWSISIMVTSSFFDREISANWLLNLLFHIGRLSATSFFASTAIFDVSDLIVFSNLLPWVMVSRVLRHLVGWTTSACHAIITWNSSSSHSWDHACI